MLNPATVQSDIEYAISETGKDVRHKRFSYTTGSIYGTPTAVSTSIDENIKVRWCRVDKSLKVLELGNYDVGDVIALCMNTVNIRTDDIIYEDYVSSTVYGDRYKIIRIESANVGGINVYNRAICKRVI